MSSEFQAHRMHQLERDLHHTRILAMCGLLMGGVLTVSAFQRRSDPVVRAEWLDLVTQQGSGERC